MKLTELFIAEIDREAPLTRRVLEVVPEGKGDWKPHPKSMPLGYLSSLVAMMPFRAITTDRVARGLGAGRSPVTWAPVSIVIVMTARKRMV